MERLAMTDPALPRIIQGGMGAAVSGWQLARAVARTGQLGVVSGTAIDTVVARRLQSGDLGGDLRRALAAFPYRSMVDRILHRYLIPGGKGLETPFRGTHVLSDRPHRRDVELVVAANFAEVYLAKQGHAGLVGINYLEKIQTPTLPSLFGALLAGVDFVLMGAGIPRAIPGVLDRLARGEPAELRLHVEGAIETDRFVSRFDPEEFAGAAVPQLRRPRFVAIVASTALAQTLVRKSDGRVDGLVIEGPTAGGHNAPPRGPLHLNSRGEPQYGPRDLVDLNAIRTLGLPFWLAGSFGAPSQLVRALEVGAAGIQVGTAFAFCEESGLHPSLRDRVLADEAQSFPEVFTDPLASPTGFPFKVLQLSRTMSDPAVYENRFRTCDLGFLRQAYRRPDGSIGWRCPGEPVASFVRKGGDARDTVGRKCLCNGLLANIGLAQQRGSRGPERPLITCGDDLQNIRQLFQRTGANRYSAADVVDYLLSGTTA